MTLEEETESDEEPHTANVSASASASASVSASVSASAGDLEHCKFHGKKVSIELCRCMILINAQCMFQDEK